MDEKALANQAWALLDEAREHVPTSTTLAIMVTLLQAHVYPDDLDVQKRVAVHHNAAVKAIGGCGVPTLSPLQSKHG